MKAAPLVALLLLSVACQDSTSPSNACSGEMADARRTLGTPFNIEKSGDEAFRLEVWDFHDGDNIRRYRFRWGTLTEGCTVEVEIIAH